jgi:transposase-like protein
MAEKPEKFTVKDFFARFPNDDACLEHVMEVRFGLRHTCRKCGVDATFHKLNGNPKPKKGEKKTPPRKAYACAACGDNLYPCVGTIFEDSRTSMQTWFYAIYLFVTTRHGVSAKELQRTLGVTYKCAWRMGQQVRILMERADGFELLQGHVELDEAYVGGARPGKRGRGAAGKTIVMGLKQRGGRLAAQVIPNVKTETLRGAVLKNVLPGSIVSTDELPSYNLLTGDGYKHGAVNHGRKEWMYYDYRHDAFHHTNNVESFWRLFKNSVKSTHIHVSGKYMSRYLNEFTFRSNHRAKVNGMFDLLIGAV